MSVAATQRIAPRHFTIRIVVVFRVDHERPGVLIKSYHNQVKYVMIYFLGSHL